MLIHFSLINNNSLLQSNWWSLECTEIKNKQFYFPCHFLKKYILVFYLKFQTIPFGSIVGTFYEIEFNWTSFVQICSNEHRSHKTALEIGSLVLDVILDNVFMKIASAAAGSHCSQTLTVNFCGNAPVYYIHSSVYSHGGYVGIGHFKDYNFA